MDESEKRRAYRLIEQLKKDAEPPPREDSMTKTKPGFTAPTGPAQPKSKATKRGQPQIKVVIAGANDGAEVKKAVEKAVEKAIDAGQADMAPPQPPKRSKIESLWNDVLSLRSDLEEFNRREAALRTELADARKEVETLKEQNDELRLNLDRVTSRLRAARTDDRVQDAVLRLLMEGLCPTDHEMRGFSWKEIGYGRVGGPYFYIANKWVNHDEATKIIDCLTDRGAAPTHVQSPNQHGI